MGVDILLGRRRRLRQTKGMVAPFHNLQCRLAPQAAHNALQERHITKCVAGARNKQQGFLDEVEMRVPQLFFRPGGCSG